MKPKENEPLNTKEPICSRIDRSLSLGGSHSKHFLAQWYYVNRPLQSAAPTCRTMAACLLNDWRVAESGWSATEASPGAPRLAWPLHRSTSPPASLSNTDWRQGADYCSRTPIAQNCLKCQQHGDGDVVMVVLTSAWLTDYLAVNKKVENSFQKRLLNKKNHFDKSLSWRDQVPVVAIRSRWYC